MFNTACLHCGVRIIQQIGAYRISPTDCSKRRRAMLDSWVAWGHDEQQIRALVKGVHCIGKEKDTA